MERTVVWFSAGATSAVAAKLTLAEADGEVVIAYTDPGSEHEDNERFIVDCEHWFGQPVLRLKSKRYEDTWQLWHERRYLVVPTGALCTAELKKKVRFDFQRPDDIHVFGFSIEETKRADRFIEQNPGVNLITPLITHQLTKADCLAMIERAGITLPVMYQLGYDHNNCVGCVKGGMGYWNKIRVDFPDVFERMGKMERHLGHAVLRDKDGLVWLDELDPTRGNFKAEPNIECGVLCELAEEVIAAEGPVTG